MKYIRNYFLIRDPIYPDQPAFESSELTLRDNQIVGRYQEIFRKPGSGVTGDAGSFEAYPPYLFGSTPDGRGSFQNLAAANRLESVPYELRSYANYNLFGEVYFYIREFKYGDRLFYISSEKGLVGRQVQSIFIRYEDISKHPELAALSLQNTVSLRTLSQQIKNRIEAEILRAPLNAEQTETIRNLLNKRSALFNILSADVAAPLMQKNYRAFLTPLFSEQQSVKIIQIIEQTMSNSSATITRR